MIGAKKGLDVLGWQAKHLKAKINIVVCALGFEKNFLVEKFSKNAPEAPHVNFVGVVTLVLKEKFRSSVVLGGHVLREEVAVVDVVSAHVGLAEVRNSNVKVFVNQDV